MDKPEWGQLWPREYTCSFFLEGYKAKEIAEEQQNKSTAF